MPNILNARFLIVDDQDGTPTSDAQLEQAVQQIRDELDAHGPVALKWLSSNLIGLAATSHDQP
jgi:hypothetical protein